MIWSELLLRALGALGMAILPLVATPFLVSGSRKVVGRIQNHRRPGGLQIVTGPPARLRTLAAVIKQLSQGLIIPHGADRAGFVAAPILAVALALATWAVIPLGPEGLQVADLEIGVLYVVTVSLLAPLAVLLAGWSSRTGNAEDGAFRAISHLISHKVPLILALLVPVMLSGSLSLQEIVLAQQIPYILPVPLAALLFLLAAEAEVGRLPLGGAEASGAIATGTLDEYSGTMLSAFNLAEYVNSFTVSVLFSVFFLGGWRGPWLAEAPFLGTVWLLLKAFVVFNLLVFIRAALPRLRRDQLLAFNWTYVVPLGMLVLVTVALVDKLIVTLGVTSVGWWGAGLLAANLVIGLGMVAVLVWVERAGKVHRAAPGMTLRDGPRPEER